MKFTAMNLLQLRTTLREYASPERALMNRRFFKTGRGQYSEGDRFLGIRVPDLRSLVRKADAVTLRQAVGLLGSQWHEERLLGLLLMERRYHRAPDESMKGQVVESYLGNSLRVNNWDLVDASAPSILGSWLLLRGLSVPSGLAASENLWERRIAMVSTLTLIRAGHFDETMRLAEMLIGDPEDLMHKACGWMLREVGKRNRDLLDSFLETHAGLMPRTMLRYSIERLPSLERQHWMSVRRTPGLIQSPLG